MVSREWEERVRIWEQWDSSQLFNPLLCSELIILQPPAASFLNVPTSSTLEGFAMLCLLPEFSSFSSSYGQLFRCLLLRSPWLKGAFQITPSPPLHQFPYKSHHNPHASSLSVSLHETWAIFFTVVTPYLA